eukprot:TRINITY_DN840_c0_g1_i1.p1 TRINITY_DN840_c0_g1~~TRINITY_DN840_c0_g1_i1.p1  ORF type:complete len:158 (-),score=34.16 TRINITY_DN840_c0_g1_i1:71-544(-)
MPHSFGYKNRTRHLFKKSFRTAGPEHLSTYFKTYKRGDIVDIVANPAIQKSMPHKSYHGRTGTVWNVTPRALGLEVNKLVRGRVFRKRIHVRVEHVRPSTSRQAHLNRVEFNDKAKREGQKGKICKRIPGQPREAYFVTPKAGSVVTVTPLKYELVI